MTLDVNNKLIWALAPQILKNGDNPMPFFTGSSFPVQGPEGSGSITSVLDFFDDGNGYVDGVFEFDATNDVISNSHRFVFSATKQLTIEWWYRPDTLGSLDVFGQQVENSSNRFICRKDADNTLRFFIEKSGTEYRVRSSNTLTADLQHIVYVMDSTAQKLYINGIEATYSEQDNYLGGDFAIAGDFQIGSISGLSLDGGIEFFGAYAESWDSTRVSEEYAYGSDKGGLLGYISGSNLLVVSPSTGDIGRANNGRLTTSSELILSL